MVENTCAMKMERAPAYKVQRFLVKKIQMALVLM